MKELFSEIPCLKGERVTLRALTSDDADGLRELTGDEEVYRYLPTVLFEKRYDDAEEVISRLYDECLNDSLILGIFTQDRFCGLAEVYGCYPALRKVSIGCRLARAAWGQHLAAEALGLLLDHLTLEKGIEVVTASVMTDNPMSPRSLKKLGFKRVTHGVEKDWGFDHPVKTDLWELSDISSRRNDPTDSRECDPKAP